MGGTHRRNVGSNRLLVPLRCILLAVSTVIVVGPLSTVQAQQIEAAQAEAGEVEEGEFHDNTLSLFLGGVTNTETDKNGFALGADYERRLSRLLGVGLVAELTIGGERPRDIILVVPLSLHPVRGWRFIVAPGFEIKPPGAAEGEEGAESEDQVLEAVLRLGASYEFELGRYTIAPAFEVDIVKFEEIVLVYGVAFGIGF